MKKLLALLLAFAMSFAFVACESKDDDDDSETKRKKRTTTSANVSGEYGDDDLIKNYDDMDDFVQSSRPSGNGYTNPPADAPSSSAVEIKEKDFISITDVCEFTLEHVKFSSKVVPPTIDGYYSYYEADKDKIYLDICFSYKNLLTTHLDTDDVMKGKLHYGDYYSYTGFTVIETDSRTNLSAYGDGVSPLSTEYLHYLIEVPTDVQNGEGNIAVVLTIGGNEYKIVVKDGVKYKNGNDVMSQGAVAKNGGSFAADEIVYIKNVSEFKLDYCEIVNDVIPKNHDSYYSHYEADDGKLYVDICFEYKSFAPSTIRNNDAVDNGKLIADGKYEYTGFSIVDKDNRSSFTSYGDIIPLSTEYVHYLFEIPESVKTDGMTMDIQFDIGGNTYTYKVN